MKKKRNVKEDDDLQAEYDLSKLKGGVRGKHAKQFAAGTNHCHFIARERKGVSNF